MARRDPATLRVGTENPYPSSGTPHHRVPEVLYKDVDMLDDSASGYKDLRSSLPDFHIPPNRPTTIITRLRDYDTVSAECDKPYDEHLQLCIATVGARLLEVFPEASIAYCCHDDVTLVLKSFDRQDTGVQKVVSLAASEATAVFTDSAAVLEEVYLPATFEAIISTYPEIEVLAYLNWRQSAEYSYSLDVFAKHYLPEDKVLELGLDKASKLIKKEHGQDWFRVPSKHRRGYCILRDKQGNPGVDWDIPSFSKDPGYLEDYL